MHFLYLIKEEVCPFIKANACFDVFIESSCIHIRNAHRLKVHFNNLVVGHSSFPQMLCHQLH